MVAKAPFGLMRETVEASQDLFVPVPAFASFHRDLNKTLPKENMPDAQFLLDSKEESTPKEDSIPKE
jgi:hypothetical protein